MHKRLLFIINYLSLFGVAWAQKGEKSISAGILLAFPASEQVGNNYINPGTGVGVEGIGQYNFTNKSSILLQLQLTHYGSTYIYRGFTGLSLKGGYRYQLPNSGFYANVLAGVEQDSDGYLYTSAALGVGKRFAIKDKEVHFIDVGADYVVGTMNRLNIKAVLGLLKRPKNN